MKKIYKQIHEKQKISLFILLGVIMTIFSLLVFISPADAQQRESRNIAHSSQNTISAIDPDLGYNPMQVLVKLAPEPAVKAREKETVRSISRTVFRDRSLQRPQEIRKVFDARNIENHEVSRWFTFDFKTAEEAERFIVSSRLNPWVQSVERDVIQSTQIVPQDEFFQEGSLESLWGHDLINVQDLWNVVENPGEGVVVAVVDTGVSNAGDPNNEWTHLDLLGSEWVGSDGTVLGSSPSSIAPVWEDYNGHGTHVAGTIGARANDFGIPGIAFDSTIMAYKLSNGGGWLSSTSAAGIIYAVDNGASIINASFGGVRNSMTDDAVKYAFDNDVLFVAAAGNDYGTNVCKKSPGGSEYAVAVSSVDKNANISSFSNIGTGIDVAAPGGGFTGPGSQHRILSTATKSPNGIGSPVVYSQGEPYTAINGTSMATPHVAAAAAIIRQLRPNWNVEEVWAGLKFISQEPASSVYNQGFGYGLLDMSKILDLPETIPVAQMYEPQNCYSPSETGVVTIKGSAYVSGSFVPDQIRIEFAQGHSVSDSDFELLTVVNQEVADDVLYVWDATSYPLGNYTLRVVTEFDGVTVEDRNQISFIQYDYKTALRMSIARILGFDSIMPSSPETSQGYGFAPKSYFNRFLHEYNEETEEFIPLVQYPTGEFNGVINYPNPSPSFTSDNVWYKGFVQSNLATYELEPVPVLSPAQFTQRSLAAFDNSRTDQVYLTYPLLEIGEQKIIHPHEKEVLCHLGFAVDGASEICEQHVPVPVTDYKTFSASSPFVCVIPGINDLFRGVAPIVNNQSAFEASGAYPIVRLLFSVPDIDIAGVQLGSIQCPTALTSSFGGGLINNLTRRTASFFFNESINSSKQARYNVVANSNLAERRMSQDGKIILWFCENPYNYICNGNFEKGRNSESIMESYQSGSNSNGGNHLLQRLVADNWASIGTADLYMADIPVDQYVDLGVPSTWWGQNPIILPTETDPFNTRFAGFANTTNITAGSDHREVIFTQLGRSFDVGQEYQIRFDVWSSSVNSSIPGYGEYISDPNVGDHLLYVVGSSNQFSLASQILNENGGVNLSVFDEVFVEVNLDEVGAYDSWVTLSQNFIPSTEDISFIYIISHAEITNMDAMIASGKTKYSRYTNLDNFIVEPQLPYRDLRVQKNIETNPQTSIGQNVSFEVIVTNDSQESVEEVKVQDYLPQGFVLSSATSSQGQDYIYSQLDNMISWQDITLQAGESIIFAISGTFTVCVAEFRNVAIAYSNLYLDETPENNFVDVYRQGFPFNDEIDNYTGFAGGEMGCVGTVSGRVFADNNQNQIQDLGETGIGQIEIGLYKQEQDGTHTLEQTVFSSVQNLGFYSFNPQSMGTYVVSLVNPNMFNITLPNDSEVFLNGSLENYVLSMINGASYTDRNFGIMQGRVIEGFVYEDSNVNGAYDFGEALLSGVDVGLFWDEGDGYYTFIDSVLTDNNGLYSFIPDIQYLDADLLLRVYVPGDTNIQAITQPVYSAPVDHPNPVFVENTYSLPAGQPSESPYIFGVIYEDVEIVEEVVVRPAGTVYQDVDASGSFDPFVDVRLGGYTVNLFKKISDTEYELISQQESLDSSGFYSFLISLSYGEYYLVIDAQHLENVNLSVPDFQNIIIENSPYHYSFTVDENTPNGLLLPGNDFGFILNEDEEPTILIRPGGFIFQDVDGNGLYNPSVDFPLSGYRVDLYRLFNNGTYQLIESQQSDSSGYYSFSVVVPYGEYSLVLHPQHVEDSTLSVPDASLETIGESPYYYTFIVDGNPLNSNTTDNNFGFIQDACYPFDINGDGLVNASDLGSFMAAFGSTGIEYDFNGDGVVDHIDMLMILSYFGCSSDISGSVYKMGGFVFDDINENGTYDEYNTSAQLYRGVMGVPVFLYKQNANNTYELVSQTTSSPALSQQWSQVIGPSLSSHPAITGSYIFEVSEPGNYAITLDANFINQSGYSITSPNGSSEVINGSHRVHFVTLEPAQNEFISFMDYDFGLNTCGCWNHFVGSVCLVDNDDLLYFNNVLFGNVCEEGQFCPGDYNQDGQVSNTDLLWFLSHYGCSKQTASSFYNFETTQNVTTFLPLNVSLVSDDFSYNNESGFYERVIVLDNQNGPMLSGLSFLPSPVILHTIKPIGLDLNFVDVLTDYSSELLSVFDHVGSRNLFAVQTLPANTTTTFIFRFSQN